MKKVNCRRKVTDLYTAPGFAEGMMKTIGVAVIGLGTVGRSRTRERRKVFPSFSERFIGQKDGKERISRLREKRPGRETSPT